MANLVLKNNTSGGTTSVTADSFIGNASSASKWLTARTITIGHKGQSLNGTTNVTYTPVDIFWNPSTVSSATDWNAILTPGVCMVHGGSGFTGTGNPGSTYPYGGLYTVGLGGTQEHGHIAQFYMPHNMSNAQGIIFRSGWHKTYGEWQTLLDSRNYTSYTVTKTGSGASGTWGISISGNAATASSVSWENVSGKPSSFTPASHTHSYLPLSGGTVTGRTTFSAQNNTTNPAGQTIFLDGVYGSTSTALAPGIGFHIGNQNWGTLKFLSDGSFRFYNSDCNGYKPIYASTFYGNLSGTATMTGTLIGDVNNFGLLVKSTDRGSGAGWTEGIWIEPTASGFATLALGRTDRTSVIAMIHHSNNHDHYLEKKNSRGQWTYYLPEVSGTLINSGNIGSQSVNYANSAGVANYVNAIPASSAGRRVNAPGWYKIATVSKHGGGSGNLSILLHIGKTYGYTTSDMFTILVQAGYYNTQFIPLGHCTNNIYDYTSIRSTGDGSAASFDIEVYINQPSSGNDYYVKAVAIQGAVTCHAFASPSGAVMKTYSIKDSTHNGTYGTGAPNESTPGYGEWGALYYKV